VVVAAEEGNVAAAAEAISAGATDFLVCGSLLGERIATLLGKLRGLWEVLDENRRLDEHNARLRESLEAKSEIVGNSPSIRALLAAIARVAPIHRPLLIVGERGTGKELVARAIHRLADAKNATPRPLITVNCAAFSDTLLESELFGHEKGAFTGADALRRGKFELAGGGTLFLDEIGHMSLPFQQKILRVVEYATFTRVGGQEDLRTTARIVAATNCDLRDRIRSGKFLADLYDRLSFEVLEVPPLRERKGDVALLADHFLEEFARETPAFRGKRLSKAALGELARYPFPGNVRELKNIIERAAYRETDAEIGVAELGLPLADELEPGVGRFEERVEAFERRLIVDALAKCDGNQAAAARLLGLTYHQFRYYYGRLVVAK
jgi:transcriptional regulator with GAF, ATPase, and Fis domain